MSASDGKRSRALSYCRPMMGRGMVVVLALLATTSCAGADAEQRAAQPAPTESPASPPSEGATPTRSPTPTPTAAVVQIVCYDPQQDTDVVGGPAELSLFWPHQFDDCYDSTSTGTPSDIEQRALETAYPKNPRVSSLATLYSICAENDSGWMSHIRTAGSPPQLRELEGALILCPDHPQRQKAEGFVEVAQANNKLEEEGRIFYDGTYRVGKKVPPGTYFAKPGGDGCYWERTDRAGNIIDNNYSNGLRVEMTVDDADFSITVEGCGEWRPVVP